MEAMRQSWTDDRLDDLRDDLNGFRAETKAEFTAVRGETKAEFAVVRTEMKAEFGAMRSEIKVEFAAVRKEMRDESRALRAEMATGFNQIHERLDRLFLAMIGFGGVMVASLIGLIATRF